MSKNKYTEHHLINVIYESIFNIVDDETNNPSYRKYFDKVIRDILNIDGLITSMLMSGNQFKFIKKMLNDNDYKAFCQMMLRDEDIKAIHDLVRVAYDAAQIAYKPKKRISSKDIKAYRYLTKLYTQGIKALRKKYKVDKSTKKEYKNKYSDLNKFLGKPTSSYEYDLNYSDDDESFGDLFEDDDDDDSQFDPENNLDLEDLPPKFILTSKDSWNPPKKSKMILDEDEDSNLELYEDSENDNEDEELIMPEGKFQRYSMSIFERLLAHLEKEEDYKDENSEVSQSSSILDTEKPYFSNDEINWHESPIAEDGTKYTSMIKDGYLMRNPAGFTADGESIMQEFTIEVHKEESEPKDYSEMSREEIINEFNSSNRCSELAKEEDITKPEGIESMGETGEKLTQ